MAGCAQLEEKTACRQKNSMLHVASKKAAAQELDLGSFEAKIALRVAVLSEGLESKASPNKNWTWVVSGTKICGGSCAEPAPLLIDCKR